MSVSAFASDIPPIETGPNYPDGPPAPSGAIPGLAVASSPSDRISGKSRAEYDAGTVSAYAGKLSHRFVLRNDSNHPLTVTRFGLSDAHSHVSLADGTAAPISLPYTLAAGTQATLELSMPAPKQAGLVIATADVFVEGNAKPVTRIGINATILPAVILSVDRLDFGITSLGQSQASVVTATFDPQALGDRQPPALTSTNPAVLVQPMPVVEQKADGPFAAATSSVTRQFRVTLAADAPMGAVGGELRFAKDPVADFSQSHIDLSGTVAGDVVAQPAIVTLRRVFGSRPVVRMVAVSAEQAGMLDEVSLSSSDAAIEARWLDDAVLEQGSGRYVRHLSLKVGSGWSAANTDGRIKGRLRDGRSFTVPISGE